ncbi:MAG TPA: DUF3153 domain-containing protein [Actinomycetaceae bacterium]|nr:DUF3153 domain-containing protein [Actinomycetaceae bacterium]
MTQTHGRILALLVTGLALLLGGCMRVHYDFTLNPDDTVSGSMIMAISDETAQSVGMDPQEAWEGMKPELEGELPPNVQSSLYVQDGYTGSRYVFENQPLAEFGTDTSEFTITREGDEYVVSGEMDLRDAADDPTVTPMLESMDLRLAITFPGKVTEATGDVAGTTVTWSPQAGELTDIQARGSAVIGGGELPWLAVGIGGLVIVAVVVAFFVIRSRRSTDQPALASAAPELPTQQQ